MKQKMAAYHRHVGGGHGAGFKGGPVKAIEPGVLLDVQDAATLHAQAVGGVQLQQLAHKIGALAAEVAGELDVALDRLLEHLDSACDVTHSA